MKARTLTLIPLAALLVAAAPAFAQRGKGALEEVRALLAGPSPAERARGAVLAAKHRLADATPDLLKVVRGYQPYSAGPYDAFAVEAALDALIQIGARVGGGAAGSELADLPPRFDHPVIVLLARNPGLHQHGLLRTVDRQAEPGEATFSAAVAAVLHLLVAQKTAGLASCAYKHLDQRVEVWVTRDGRKRRIDESADAHAAVPPQRVPKGFPPIGFYRLEAGRGGKGKLVGSGKSSIGFVRVVASAGEAVEFPKPRAPQPSTHEVAIEILTELLGAKSRRLLATVPRELTVRYRTDEQLEQDLERIRTEAQKGYRAILDQLCEKRLLRADEAKALERKIDLDVHYPPRERK